MFKGRADDPPPDTRTLIVDTALRLFEERGYAGTTMRAIATEAGLSPSNAYYWFDSKDQLVQEFYLRIQVAHRERSAEALAAGGPSPSGSGRWRTPSSR